MVIQEPVLFVNVMSANDDAGTLCELEFTLKKWDLDAIAVPDGLAAVEVLHNNEPSSVSLLDIDLPGRMN